MVNFKLDLKFIIETKNIVLAEIAMELLKKFISQIDQHSYAIYVKTEKNIDHCKLKGYTIETWQTRNQQLKE